MSAFEEEVVTDEEPMFVETNETSDVQKTTKRENIWYANCICLADILDSDHDLSRKPGDENPLETYWNKFTKNEDVKNVYKQIFVDGQKTRTQLKIHKMFMEIIDKFGPKFEGIDGPNTMPRIALSVRNVVCKKTLAAQRDMIHEDSGLKALVVETHRGGSYDARNETPAQLYKYTPSTIFDNGNKVGFLTFDPSNNYTFSNNYFPESSTRMTTKKLETAISAKDISENEFLLKVLQSETGKSWTDDQLLLLHTFKGKDGPTYSVQWGQVTADEVTFELFGQNRRSYCNKIRKVEHMRFSIPDPVDKEDILARNCHILYGKTCGDGVSIDAAEQMKCGVLSNDICCCYRAAIVNGFGYRACPSANKFFSTERLVEVFQTKPKGEFDKETAKTNVKALLESFNTIEPEKTALINFVESFSINPLFGRTINYLNEILKEKKDYLKNVIRGKQIPDDLKPYTQVGDVPEDLLKRYCYYSREQCIGSKEFYETDLKQFVVEVKSNIEQLKKLRLSRRSSEQEQDDCFGESLLIIANIELVLSSFIMDNNQEPDKEKILKYSQLFFTSNLTDNFGASFFERFRSALNKAADAAADAAAKETQKIKQNVQYLRSYIDHCFQRDDIAMPSTLGKRKTTSSMASPQKLPLSTMTQEGGNQPELLSYFLVPLLYEYEDIEEAFVINHQSMSGSIEDQFFRLSDEEFQYEGKPIVNNNNSIQPLNKSSSTFNYHVNKENQQNAINAFRSPSSSTTYSATNLLNRGSKPQTKPSLPLTKKRRNSDEFHETRRRQNLQTNYKKQRTQTAGKTKQRKCRTKKKKKRRK